MVKWMRLAKNQYLGFFALGLVLVLLQELPYAVMPFVRLPANPLMEMQDKSVLLNAMEKVLGISCIVLMLFLVRGDATWFSLRAAREKLFLGLAIGALMGYYIGWILYFCGQQGLALILLTLVAMPPLYYALIGLWRKNYPLAVLGGLFLMAHLCNVWNNLR
jgi:hypothetical protein